jgi:hypothetical protein
MLESGVNVGLGTDATRVASYNPWIGIYWLVTGKTLGGLTLYPPHSRIDRETALRLYTEGSAWFSTENGKKGAMKIGQYADVVVPSADLFSIPESDIKDLYSILTIVGGKIVHASETFGSLSPPALPISPEWSPVRTFGGYQHEKADLASLNKISRVSCGCGTNCSVHGHAHASALASNVPANNLRDFWGMLGCACWA